MQPYDTPVSEHSMSYRIREERLRLGFDEVTLAEEIGISQERVRALETDDEEPLIDTAELAYLANLGADVQYILIAQRSVTLSPEEQALVDNYRASTDEQKAKLKAVSDAIAQSRLNEGDSAVGR